MAKFRKKSMVIEARQFNGHNCIELLLWMNVPGVIGCLELHTTDHPIVHTIDGDMTTEIGDWIIKSAEGEFFPCKPDIFAATYELAEEPSEF